MPKADAFAPSDHNLAGLHVLVLLPPSKKEMAKYLTDILDGAKARWNWTISVVCENVDQKPFQNLIAPGGQTYARPSLLKTQPWESDPAAVANVEANMREAERVTRVPTGRIILAGAHSIGRAFNAPVLFPKKTRLAVGVLKDNGLPYRVVRRLFRFSENLLDTAKPDLVFAWEWVTPLHNVICTAARRRGIPCFSQRRSKISPDHGYWTLDALLFNSAAAERAKSLQKARTPASENSRNRVRHFRDQPKVIKYIATRWNYRLQRHFIRWHLEYVRVVVRETINTLRGQDRSVRERGLARFIRYYRSLLLPVVHNRWVRSMDDAELEHTKYVYFPLHKEAELAQTFQASFWHDQRNTIRVLASMLPFGYRLLVREHRMNFGRRPTRTYKEYARIPNVTMIDPWDSQFKYLRHADLVVTENGSSGWEGLLLGRRVLLLAQTFYDGAGRGVTVTDPDRLNEAVLEALSQPAVADPEGHEDALGCLIDAETETAFAMTAEGRSAALDRLNETLSPALARTTRLRSSAA